VHEAISDPAPRAAAMDSSGGLTGSDSIAPGFLPEKSAFLRWVVVYNAIQQIVSQ
jgi:hypothetical protein